MRGNHPADLPPAITLTTDFGSTDPYVGIMKGVLLRINPQVRIVDLCHHIPAGDIGRAAFFLRVSHRYFPGGTIHLAVVDPGVGSQREGLVIRTEEGFFVGPDNGVFSYICEGDKGVASWRIDPGKVPAPGKVSNTFHGRDIFAPVAATLSLGLDPSSFGQPIEKKVLLPRPRLDVTGEEIRGEILCIDGFGNIITSIPGNLLSDDDAIEWRGGGMKGLNRCYSEVEPGVILGLRGSSGFLELSVNGGNAAELIGLRVGESIVVLRGMGKAKGEI